MQYIHILLPFVYLGKCFEKQSVDTLFVRQCNPVQLDCRNSLISLELWPRWTIKVYAVYVYRYKQIVGERRECWNQENFIYLLNLFIWDNLQEKQEAHRQMHHVCVVGGFRGIKGLVTTQHPLLHLLLRKAKVRSLAIANPQQGGVHTEMERLNVRCV